MLEELKAKEAEKVEKEMEKKRKQFEKEEKRKAKALEVEKKKEMRELNKKEKGFKKKEAELKRERKQRPRRQKESTVNHTKGRSVEDVLQGLTIDSSNSGDEEDRAVCPLCGLIYPDDGGFWVGCDGCDDWYDLKYTGIKSKRHVPDVYYCQKCRV